MRAIIYSLLAWFFIASAAHSNDIRAELVEWVIDPCMQVGAAASVNEYDREAIDLGIKREHIAEIMLASRESYIKDLLSKMNKDTTWEARRAAYPIMLKLCVLGFFKEG